MPDIKVEHELSDEATFEDKILVVLENIETEEVLQTNHLKTIKTILVIFTVLFVIGVIIQSCSR